MARLAEQAERYEDMVEYMKRVALMPGELSLEERNLLSVAYKNAVSARRSAWRSINAMMHREREAGAVPPQVMGYRQRVEAELNEKCNDILLILSSELIERASTSEPKVFYLKMKGDYHRYLAEFADAENRASQAQAAHDSYQEASLIAQAELPAVHPIRLGLALNFSVFYFEVFNSPDEAKKLAKASLDEAHAAGGLQEDSSTIVQLLSDNLDLWNQAVATEDGKPPEQDGTMCEDL